jgi:hypothetical protein
MGLQGLLQGQLYLFIFVNLVYLNTSFKSIPKKLFHLCACMRGNNLIPGVVAACRWDDESGKLLYPSTLQLQISVFPECSLISDAKPATF